MGEFDYFSDLAFPAQSGYQSDLGSYSSGQLMGPTNQELGYFPQQTQSPYQGDFGTPALSRYQEYISHAPKSEDYQMGTIGKILAGIAGASAGFQNKSPMAGFQTSMGILQSPYQQALGQYKELEPQYRQSAIMENQGIGNRIDWLHNQQQYGIDQQKLWDAQTHWGQEFQQNEQKHALEVEKADTDAKYKAGMLSDQDYQNATARMNAQANALQSAASANASNASAALSNARIGWGPQGNQGQNAGLLKQKLAAGIASNPALSQYIDEKGGLNVMKLRDDPMAMAQLNSLYQSLGMVPGDNIGL